MVPFEQILGRGGSRFPLQLLLAIAINAMPAPATSRGLAFRFMEPTPFPKSPAGSQAALYMTSRGGQGVVKCHDARWGA